MGAVVGTRIGRLVGTVVVGRLGSSVGRFDGWNFGLGVITKLGITSLGIVPGVSKV